MKLIGRVAGYRIFWDEKENVFYCEAPQEYIAPLLFQQIMRREGMLLNFAPCRTVPISDESQLGEVFGKGGTNEIFMLQDNPGIAVKNPGFGKNKVSSEYDSMIEMERLGLKTVVLGLREIEGAVWLAMKRERIAADSKSIVGYQGALKGEELSLKHYIDPNKNAPQPSKKLAQFITRDILESLLVGFDRMTAGKRSFSDFQFLITEDDEVVYNDPCGYQAKTPNKSTVLIIQAFVDTWEYLFSGQGEGQSWSDFKKAKVALKNRRLRHFNTWAKGQKQGCEIVAPIFTLTNPSFFRFATPPRCVCFAAPLGDLQNLQLAGFASERVKDNDMLFWVSDFITPRVKTDWTNIYKT